MKKKFIRKRMRIDRLIAALFIGFGVVLAAFGFALLALDHGGITLDELIRIGQTLAYVFGLIMVAMIYLSWRKTLLKKEMYKHLKSERKKTHQREVTVTHMIMLTANMREQIGFGSLTQRSGKILGIVRNSNNVDQAVQTWANQNGFFFVPTLEGTYWYCDGQNWCAIEPVKSDNGICLYERVKEN